MPDLVEQMYCSQQIHIPPTFPFILKQYCKAAIRTQPYDLLRWSAAYFRCMANGEPPPVKLRLEYPQTEFPSGLSPGYLHVLLKQFAGKQFVGAHEVFRKWRGVSLDESTLAEIFMLGRFGPEIDPLKFIAIAAAYLCEKLSRTMILLCELLTEEPEGGSAMIPCETFINLYTYLARMNCGPVLEGENARLADEWEELGGEEGVPEEQELAEEEMPEEEETQRSEEILLITDSEPQLTKCISLERTTEDLQESLKDALWEALLAKLPDEEKVPDDDDFKNLKEDLWSSVMKNLEEHSEVKVDTRTFLNSIIQDIIPDKTDKTDALPKSPSEILKTVIWDTIIQNKPPAHLKGTVWDTLSQLITDAQKETMKNELWNALVERIPSSDQDLVPDSEEGSEEPIKYVHGGEAEPVPEWVGKFVPPYRVEIKGIGPVISEEQIKAVVEYMKYWAERQEDMVMPRNIRHFLCPPLDPPEYYGLADENLGEEEGGQEGTVGEEEYFKQEPTPPEGLQACIR